MGPVDQQLVRAFNLHQAGRLSEAEALYRSLLAWQPQHPHALHLLGLICHQTGRQDEALELITQAIARFGPHPEFHCNLAAVHQVMGHHDLAAAHCRQAIELRPAYAEAHNNLGIALRDLGKPEEAEAAFREAARLNPNYVDPLCNLGALLNVQERRMEALPILLDAVGLAPAHALSRFNLGVVFYHLGQADQAVIHLAEAVRLEPKHVRAYPMLGVALERLHYYREAEIAYREAINLSPDDIEGHNKLGILLLNQGRTAEALAEFQATLKNDPDNSMAFLNLGKMVSSGFHQFSDAEIQRIHEAAAKEKLTDEGRGRLHYALGQVYDKQGKYDDAFEHLKLANELKKNIHAKNETPFDPAKQTEFVNRLIAAYSPAYFERTRGWGIDSELPVFIVGMPRSGTSLTEQILACHPQVHGAGELSEIDGFAATLAERLGVAEIPYPECMAHLDQRTVRLLANAHATQLQKMKPDARRVTDKAPLNFFHVGILASFFPRARIIHCRRNPVDTCLSCYFQNFAEAFAFTADLTSLGQYYREYQRIMAYWDRVLPGRIFQLDYEAMTADQETMSRKLVAHCGLEWDDRCLNFHENDRTVRTFSSLQVRRPMYRSSVERWRRYERHLGPLLESLGIH